MAETGPTTGQVASVREEELLAFWRAGHWEASLGRCHLVRRCGVGLVEGAWGGLHALLFVVRDSGGGGMGVDDIVVVGDLLVVGCWYCD